MPTRNNREKWFESMVSEAADDELAWRGGQKGRYARVSHFASTLKKWRKKWHIRAGTKDTGGDAEVKLLKWMLHRFQQYSMTYNVMARYKNMLSYSTMLYVILAEAPGCLVRDTPWANDVLKEVKQKFEQQPWRMNSEKEHLLHMRTLMEWTGVTSGDGKTICHRLCKL